MYYIHHSVPEIICNSNLLKCQYILPQSGELHAVVVGKEEESGEYVMLASIEDKIEWQGIKYI